ncbi:TetR/AcrR family transcriptional regulator [Geodermatophilus sp. SYSU D00691]
MRDEMTAAGDARAPRELGPRERMVRSAMALIAAHGVSGTGMRQVVEHADAPRGSLQHYFPEGKEQLVREALALARRTASRTVTRLHDEPGPVRPSDVIATMVRPWRGWLTGSEFAQGCPAVATVADAVTASDGLRSAAEELFAVWQRAVQEALEVAGVPAARAPRLAAVCISALEGAIVLSRARHDLSPLDDVETELGPLLDAAAAPAGRPRRAR